MLDAIVTSELHTARQEVRAKRSELVHLCDNLETRFEGYANPAKVHTIDRRGSTFVTSSATDCTPQQFVCSSISGNRASLQWAPPRTPHGALVKVEKYQVVVREEGNDVRSRMRAVNVLTEWAAF